MSRTLPRGHPRAAGQVDDHGFMLWNLGWPYAEGWPRCTDGQAFDGRYRVLSVSLKGKVRLTYPSQAGGPYGRPVSNAGPMVALAATHLRGLRRAGRVPGWPRDGRAWFRETLYRDDGCTDDGDCRNHGGP